MLLTLVSFATPCEMKKNPKRMNFYIASRANYDIIIKQTEEKRG